MLAHDPSQNLGVDSVCSLISLGYSKIVLPRTKEVVEDVIQKLFDFSSDPENFIHKLVVHLSFVPYAFGDYGGITSGLHKIENLSNEESRIATHFLEFQQVVQSLNAAYKSIFSKIVDTEKDASEMDVEIQRLEAKKITKQE